ncbi:hypothetical protein M758_8G102600 [Ceratodon purpureus]|nr:hypothetical protein M758_8G102600 [Ceratodon purpureus]KAG0608392.1 hypothetical protein M758_8G102600 [Ceratodon purpureus]KAG0608393.1 hypothetical protein M758_8G102600 [Ceratodon purpureus]
MGTSVRSSLVRYYSISALIVGFWLLASSFWLPGKITVGVIRHDAPTSIRAYAHGRMLKSLESEADEVDESLPEGFDALSPLDLVSDEELAVLQESLPKMYHSPEIFALSYDEMWNKMQVWVYPEQEGSQKYEHKYDGQEEELTEELSSTADLFFRLLKRSEFVTESPSHAHLFLMPVSIDALWVDLGPTNVAEQLRRYLQKIRTDFPYWDSSLGADHLYLSCHAFEHNSKHRNILELGKNAIQAACSPLRHNQQFYPHKDMVFPEYKPVSEHEIHAALASRTERTTLAYFPAGSPEISDPDFDVEVDPSPHRSSVYSKLARSKFCVSIPPHESLSVVDALRFGCVPVLVSKTVFHDLPLQGFLNWREFAVVLGMEDLPKLKTILESVPAAKYRQMQYLGHQASKHLEWNNPPVAYDAFHMTLVDLWIRRHSIKYARRTFS